MLVVRRNSCVYHRYFRRYTRELYGRLKANLLHLKAWMVKSEVVEALLYGCATLTPRKSHYN